MRTLAPALALLLAVVCVPACGNKKDEAPAKVEASAGVAADKPAAPAAKPAPAAAPANPSTVGVSECDDYVTKYMKCIDKMPPDGRPAARDALNQAVDAWKSAATSPDVRSQLATACKSAMDTQKQATQSIGCEW